MDLIQAVLDSTKSVEAPVRFYYWSTLAAISAVLKDRVWFNMGNLYRVYPNVYILLYGPSGIRKGPPISLAERLVTEVDVTRVIDGRSSIEAVIKDLGSFQTRPGKAAIKDSCCFMVASELSSSIVGNPAAMDIMTDFFDRIYHEGDWKYRLKNSESSTLKKPTITWLAGTNEALFKDFIPEKNLYGGLIGRMFIITENKKANTNSLMWKTNAPDIKVLAAQLAQISRLEGEFTMADEVRHAVDSWYNKFDKTIMPTLGDNTGFASRIGDFVIKIAMILSCGRRLDKIITIEDTKEAIDVVLPLLVPTKRVVNSVKKTDNSLVTKRALVLTYLSNKPDFSERREILLQNLGLQIDHEDLDKITTFMIQMQVLTIENTGGVTRYKLRVDRPEVASWVKQYRS